MMEEVREGRIWSGRKEGKRGGKEGEREGKRKLRMKMKRSSTAKHNFHQGVGKTARPDNIILSRYSRKTCLGFHGKLTFTK